jgi:hypothetical protein
MDGRVGTLVKAGNVNKDMEKKQFYWKREYG